MTTQTETSLIETLKAIDLDPRFEGALLSDGATDWTADNLISALRDADEPDVAEYTWELDEAGRIVISQLNEDGFIRTPPAYKQSERGEGYATVEAAFERVYQQLREDNGENAPNSNVYYAATFPSLLAEAAPFAEEIQGVADGEAEAEVLGDPDSPTVAWAFECNGNRVYRITEWATDGELVEFFGHCMGYDL